MATSPIDFDADIENRLESPTAVTPDQTSATPWPPRPNFSNLPNIWAENKLNFEPPKYSDTSETYWKLYEQEAKNYDANFIGSLMGNTTSMVYLNTLLSAIIASFIIEIYKTLSPTNSQPTVIIPEGSAIRINIVLFVSFFLSTMSSVSCLLIQQWCYEYGKFAYPRANVRERGLVRSYLFQGLAIVLPIRIFMYWTHTLLHISVILFFWAIGEYFNIVNHSFGLAIRYTLIFSAALYALISISPLFFSNSPYNTPMTHLLRAASIILRIIFRLPLWCSQWLRRKPVDLTGLQYYEGVHFDTARLLSIKAKKEAKMLEPYAMKWLFTDNDLSDSDMDTFLESLPGYVSSSLTEKGQLDEYLTADHIKSRIKQHLITCATSVELSDQDSIARLSSCVKGLVLIFQYSHNRKGHSSEQGKLEQEIGLQRMYIQGLIGDFQSLCNSDDPTAALRASCISALVVQSFVSQLVPPNNGVANSSQFPASLIPIYDYLFPYNNTIPVPRFSDLPTPSAMEMWMSLLQDGPLANLTRLAQAIRDREYVPSLTLSFCWKTLDILLTQLGTIHSDKPSRARTDFDNLHENTRTYVHDEEMGFRMTPLLEFLDTVARGRRLLLVFSSRPKYHSRAQVVFGKEYLRNGDLLEAFAQCLPDFITNNSPEVCRDVMEKVVNRDNLWTALQVNLWNTQRADSPIPEKQRMFEYCCTVLDVAFSVLEDSREVDWRAPEFGSLWQLFESFLAHVSQGTFIGLETSFRVSIIKARFCKAFLAQFLDDIIRPNVLSFRSQWDVASLEKLTYYLGLRHEDRDDAELRNSFLSGGHIGAEFTAKALEMVNIIVSDGPLTIFCQLGHLATSTMPFHHSGLKRKDIMKASELQHKLMVDRRLSLNGASDRVWEDLDRLRKLVNGLGGAASGGQEGELLQLLLQRIDDVRSLRVTRSEGLGHSGHAEE